MSYFEDHIHITFEEMLLAFSKALNLVDKRLTDHHQQVAYICFELGHVLELEESLIKELVVLALVHDIGAFKEKERSRLLTFEMENVDEHAITGYVLLKDISIYKKIAQGIQFHHLYYNNGRNFDNIDSKIALMSQIIFLADRISILILTGHDNILSRVDEIISVIESGSNRLFNPLIVKALEPLKYCDYFWLNMTTDYKDQILRTFLKKDETPVDYKTFMDFTKMFMYSIDFRSRYTATHSVGVAAVAKALAIFSGMDLERADILEIAGFYHDIGKLVVPYEILDKPSHLDLDEYSIIRQHPYFTYHILDSIDGMSEIRDIAAFHHELIDGNGYPFRLKVGKLSLESKLLTVADIFTAMSEKRPYRDKVTQLELKQLLDTLIQQEKIDQSIAQLAIVHCKELYELNDTRQKEILEEFDQMMIEKKILLSEIKGLAQQKA